MCPIRQWSPVLLHHRHKREAKQLLLSFLLCCMNEEEQLCKMSQKNEGLESYAEKQLDFQDESAVLLEQCLSSKRKCVP